MTQTQTKTAEQYYQECIAPFPDEALSTDSSRGFDLTSVKAQYIRERLNEVFGFLNWTMTGEYKEVSGGVLYLGKLTVKTPHGINTHESVGFSTAKKNVGDEFKGAYTDALSKCASNFGLANEVFKGNVAPPSKAKGAVKASSKAPGKGKATQPQPQMQQPQQGQAPVHTNPFAPAQQAQQAQQPMQSQQANPFGGYVI